MKINEIAGYTQVYYRGTNNPNEPELIRNKQIKLSHNHLTADNEAGLSVSDTIKIKRYFKYVYLVSGNEVGLGSDGEPLLDIQSLKFIKWIVRP